MCGRQKAKDNGGNRAEIKKRVAAGVGCWPLRVLATGVWCWLLVWGAGCWCVVLVAGMGCRLLVWGAACWGGVLPLMG